MIVMMFLCGGVMGQATEIEKGFHFEPAPAVLPTETTKWQNWTGAAGTFTAETEIPWYFPEKYATPVTLVSVHGVVAAVQLWSSCCRGKDKPDVVISSCNESVFMLGDVSATAHQCEDNRCEIMKWFNDSGSTRNISHKREDFVKGSLISCKVTIGLAQKGQTMVCKQKGTVRLLDHNGRVLELDNVLLVPSASARLLSTPVLDSNGFVTILGNGSCTIKKGKNVLFREAKEPKGLYTVTTIRAPKVGKSVSSDHNLHSSLCEGSLNYLARFYRGELTEQELCHNRLNHSGWEQVKLTYPKLPKAKEDSCCGKGCVEGRMHNSTFKATRDRCTYLPGQCLISDLAGPFVPTPSGKMYRGLYLDKSSDYMTNLLFARKSEQPTGLEEVRNYSRAQTGRDVTIERTDGGGGVCLTPTSR